MDITKDFVGRVIGKGGETIRDIQTRSACQCVIDQNVPDHMPRKLTIIGKEEYVKNAKAMVEAVMRDGYVLRPSYP